MREILFRGQTRKYGEKVRMNGEKLPSVWAYGGICQGKGDYSIIYGNEENQDFNNKNIVYSETVGQYTGLKDKNGTRIFEHDIVRYGDYEVPFIIEFCNFSFVLMNRNVFQYYQQRFEQKEEIYEVIGNIYDNPELLND